jgi:CRP-like cAMP-binding protein
VNSDTIMAPLFRRLQITTGAEAADLLALKALPYTLRQFRLNQTVLREGDRPSECCLIAEGFCVRSKTIADGKRQILSIHIPAVFREWIVNVGQRAAHNRLAHLIVELRERLHLIGHVTGNTFTMPLTQEQLGEAMGVTSVHTNRIIRQLRIDGVLDVQRGTVKILNERKLQEVAEFDGRYLHASPSS